MSYFGANTPASTQVVTTNIDIGEAGKPLTVFFVHLASNGSGAATCTLKNNGSSGTTLLNAATSGATTQSNYDFGASGMFFPLGCYYTAGSNVSNATIVYVQSSPC